MPHFAIIAVSILFDGLAYAMFLFITSVGLSVTMGLMGFVNLAHGAFAMAGGYGTDMEATVQVQMNTYRVALEYHARWAALRFASVRAGVTSASGVRRQNPSP